ncbi:MAG: YggS family pyridoxal phosphate-dependent enzyme [Candidatus Omnitrophica bacterium]|nr:YggS family pyridoxal phosphate-dependent enzyme [Candidatus Omnitrophota bacterium]
MNIPQAVKDLRNSVSKVAEKVGRDPEGVRLVIVTKTIEPARVLEAYQIGERDFGENRVQEWQEKKEALPRDIRWHLIGHLQTNKVKYVIGQVALIHSLDRIELADAIEKQAKAKGILEVPCLVQVNMSGEESKFGLDPDQVEDFVRQMSLRLSIKIRGLMSIGPLTEDETKIRECFRKTRELREDLRKKSPQYAWDILSMGMSSDYRIAIEEGANMLRIGSLVFPRDIKK